MLTKYHSIAIASPKGGVGKTTSVSSIGARYAAMGKKTLLVDLDYQANLTSNFLPSLPTDSVFNTFNDGILPIVNVSENMDLLPSNEDMKILDSLMSSKTDRFILQKAIMPITPKYDVILFDCPPALSWATLNAFTASGSLFVPVVADPKSYSGLSLLASGCYQSGTETRIDGIFFTMYDSRLKLTKKIEEKMRKFYENTVMQTKIRRNVALAECAEEHKDIFSFAKTSEGAKNYTDLVDEIEERLMSYVQNR